MTDYKAREFEIVRQDDDPSKQAIVVYQGSYLDEYLIVEPEFGISTSYTFIWEPTDPPSYAAPNPGIALRRGSYLVSHKGRAKTGHFDGKRWSFDYRFIGEEVPHSDEVQVVCRALPSSGWYGDGPNWRTVNKVFY